MNTILEALKELRNSEDIKENKIVKRLRIKEDLSSFNHLPVTLLTPAEVKDYVANIPAPDPHRPPTFFKLGYIKELTSDIASKFRGGRGSEGNPNIRVIKCTEYSKLYTGVPWSATDATKKADAILGTERHTGERTGFNFQGDNAIENAIGTYPSGKQALQAYISDNSVQKVKYFISINGSDLEEISREDLAQYLTPASANKLLNGSERKAAGFDAEGNALFDKPINRFSLDGIYMIGNLGHSIM